MARKRTGNDQVCYLRICYCEEQLTSWKEYGTHLCLCLWPEAGTNRRPPNRMPAKSTH